MTELELVNASVGVAEVLRRTVLSPAVYVMFAPAGVEEELNARISASVPTFTVPAAIVRTSSTAT